MSDIEFCPECEAPVIGFGDDIRCTSCGITYREMVDLVDDDFLDGLGEMMQWGPMKWTIWPRMITPRTLVTPVVAETATPTTGSPIRIAVSAVRL